MVLSLAGAPPVGPSTLIRGNRWQMPDSLFTQFFSPSPPPLGSFSLSPCNYRSPLTGSRIKSFRGTKHRYYDGLRFHEPIAPIEPDDYPSSIELGKSDLTFVAFSNDLVITLANCNVLMRMKLPSRYINPITVHQYMFPNFFHPHVEIIHVNTPHVILRFFSFTLTSIFLFRTSFAHLYVWSDKIK